MAQQVVDLNGSPTPQVQEVPEIPVPQNPPVVDSTRLGSLLENEAPSDSSYTPPTEVPQVFESPAVELTQPPVESAAEPVMETPPEIEQMPTIPEDNTLKRGSRIIHVLLSLIIIFLVVGGAALAAYFYSNSDANFIKLPKLPFIKEPLSKEEMAQETPAPEESTNAENGETAVITPDYSGKPSSESTVEKESVDVETPASSENSKGGLAVDTSAWKVFTSKKWSFSFKYPKEWFLYPRDTGTLGENTIVASAPLSSLENDVRQLTVATQNIVVGIGVVSSDKLPTQTLLQFVKDKATTFAVSSPEEITVGGRVFVRTLSLQGNVLYYYLDSGTKVYAISIKPADYAASFADQIEALVSSLNLAPQ